MLELGRFIDSFQKYSNDHPDLGLDELLGPLRTISLIARIRGLPDTFPPLADEALVAQETVPSMDGFTSEEIAILIQPEAAFRNQTIIQATRKFSGRVLMAFAGDIGTKSDGLNPSNWDFFNNELGRHLPDSMYLCHLKLPRNEQEVIFPDSVTSEIREKLFSVNTAQKKTELTKVVKALEKNGIVTVGQIRLLTGENSFRRANHYSLQWLRKILRSDESVIS